jgi:hypothetical protein
VTVRRLGLYSLAVAALAGWLTVYWHSRTSDPITAADLGPGWHRPIGPAKIPDLPKGASPISTIRGRVPFGPPAHRPLAVTGPDSGLQPPVGPSPDGSGSPGSGPCVIRPDDLSGGCRTSIAYVLGKPWAKVEWDGAVRLPGGQIVKRGPILADQVELTWTAPPPPRRTLWGLDVGLVAALGGLGYEIGGRVCPKGFALSGRLAEARLCGYGRYTQLPGRPEGAIGASILFGGGR